jgi:hypothetical protein
MTGSQNLIAQKIGNPILNFPDTTTGVSFVQGLIPALVNLCFIAGSVFFLFNAIMGGIKWTSAGGDKGHLEAARTQVTNAIIGIAVLFSLYAITTLVGNFFGVNLTSLDLGAARVNVQ